MAELLAIGQDLKNLTVVDTLNKDGSADLQLTGNTKYKPELRLTANEVAALTKAWTPAPAPVPTPSPQPNGILWTADGETAGPTDNPFLEWASYSGAEYDEGNLHPRISVVTAMDPAHGGHAPLQGKFMYRHELKPGKDAFDNERLELCNEALGYGPPPSAVLVDSGAYQWTEGNELWIAHAFYLPTIPSNEVLWSENYNGVIPIAQFHGAHATAPPWGLAVMGTRPGKTPKLWKPGTVAQWEDTVEFQAGVWYRFLWNTCISANPATGFVDGWVARGATAPFEQFIGEKGKTLTSEYTFPCMGGPRNEMNPPAGNTEVPPTVISYHDSWTFGTTRAAVEAHAFG